MHPSRWLVLVCVGFLVGVGVGVLGTNLHPWVEIGMGVGVIGLLGYHLSSPRRRGSSELARTNVDGLDSRFHGNDMRVIKILKIVGIFILSLGLGVWRMEMALEVPNQYQTWLGEKKKFEGLVIATDLRSDRLLVNVRPDGFTQLVQFRLSPKLDIKYGDRVWVTGKISEAKGSLDFDYPKFLQARGIFAIGYYPKMIVLESGQGNSVLHKLLSAKEWITSQISGRLTKDASGLVLGAIIGSREGLSPELQNWFTTAGLSHILVASGYNLTVLVAGIAGLVWWFGRRSVQILAAIAVILFVGIARAGAAIVRAGIMAGLVVLARLWGRQYSQVPSLLLAASLMVAVSPLLLVWDAGFQLSFAATAGIILGVPIIERSLEWMPKWLPLNQYLSTTIAAILATLPLVLYHFDRLSLVALPANLLVVPFVPVPMLLGSMSALPVVHWLAAPLAEWLASFMVLVARELSAWKFSVVEMSFSFVSLIVGYAILAGLWFCLRKKQVPSKVDEAESNVLQSKLL